MRNLKFLSTAIFATLLFAACSSDDDNTPEPVNEEEVITTMIVSLQPAGGGTTVTLTTRDTDGDGPTAPVVTVSGPLAAGVTYNGSITLSNETEDPAEDITAEVEEEDTDHQFFYTIAGGLDVTTTYTNFDSNNNPLGTQFALTTGAASSGNITFTLRHEPTKPNTGLADAGGETDIAATFDLMVE
jgi:hypothetical protein